MSDFFQLSSESITGTGQNNKRSNEGDQSDDGADVLCIWFGIMDILDRDDPNEFLENISPRNMQESATLG